MKIAPPLLDAPVTVLPVKMQLLIVVVNAPEFVSAPPELFALPLAIVNPDITTPLAPTLKTLTEFPPLTVRLLTPGPAIKHDFVIERALLTVIVPVTAKPMDPPGGTSINA